MFNMGHPRVWPVGATLPFSITIVIPSSDPHKKTSILYFRDYKVLSPRVWASTTLWTFKWPKPSPPPLKPVHQSRKRRKRNSDNFEDVWSKDVVGLLYASFGCCVVVVGPPFSFLWSIRREFFFLPSFPTSWVLKRAVKGHKTNILLFLLQRGILLSKYTLIHSMNHWNSDYCSRRRRWKDVLMLRKFFSPPQNISSIRAPALVKT